MKTLISNFSKQLREAINIGKNAQLSAADNTISNVLISGMGGSGIGGAIAYDTVGSQSKVPIQINKDYFIPNHVNENTLVIVSSFSGNTEETLNTLDQAIEKKAKIACITSGGKVLEIAKEHNLDHILIPGGMPPRAALAYSLTQQYYILSHFGIIGNDFEADLGSSIDLIDKEEESILETAKSIAGQLLNKIPIIYSSASCESIGVRFRQQLNENGKTLCWHHVLPEMNHNELVGWTKKSDELAVVILRNDNDYNRTQTRMDISKEIFSKYTSTIIEIFSKGETVIEKAIYLIHLGDWISYFLAEKKEIDPVEVDVITYLKTELSKV